jgi:uncharacterized protein YqcC (DUF446 family)
MVHHELCLQLLDELEQQLKQAGLWSHQAPSQEALNSNEPFCVDTLGFEQWLQFVFLPQMRSLMKQGGYLTRAAHLLPLAELSFDNQDPAIRELFVTLNRIDVLSRRLVLN